MKISSLFGSAHSLRRLILCLPLLFAPFACGGEPAQMAGGGSDAKGEAVAAAPAVEQDRPPAAAPIQVAQAETDTVDTPYSVECGQVNDAGDKYCLVDKKTYIGWRTYHAFCHVCHAQDAVGSTFAPSLVDRLQDIDKARFLETVSEGYTGQIGVMPPWKDNPNVSKRYEELYSYLKARADGALMPGRPKKKPGAK